MDENDPDEPERRARHMAEQRDRLIAMKKAEREKRVRAEEERQAKLAADGTISMCILLSLVSPFPSLPITLSLVSHLFLSYLSYRSYQTVKAPFFIHSFNHECFLHCRRRNARSNFTCKS